MHPATAHLMQFFKYDHLPRALQTVSASFCTLAFALERDLPDNPEKTAALRKLLEAKDCAVRAAVVVADAGAGGAGDTLAGDRLVQMADGRMIPARYVVPGDRLMGADGGAQIVQ